MKEFKKNSISLVILFCLILNATYAKDHEQNDSNQPKGEKQDIIFHYNLLDIEEFEKNTIKRLNETLKVIDPNTEEYSNAVFKLFSEVDTISLKLQVIEYLIPRNQRNQTKEIISRMLDVLEYLQTNYIQNVQIIEEVKSLIVKCALQDLPITENFNSSWYKDLYNRQPNIANNVTKQVIYIIYHYESISSLVTRIIYNTPTYEEKVSQMEYLLNVIRENNDVFSNKIFEYTEKLKEFYNRFKKELKKSNVFVNVTLPKCVVNVVYNLKGLCFDDGSYVVSYYIDDFNPIAEYYLYPGVCRNHAAEKKPYYFWKTNEVKNYNLRDFDSATYESTMKNVQFEVAPDENQCYIKIYGKYLTKSGDTRFLTLVNNKTSAGIWNVDEGGVYF